MLARTLLPVATVVTLLLAACSGSGTASIANAPDAIVEPGAGEPGVEKEEDGNAPHALGVVLLGETHESGASVVHALVSVSFVPDAAAQRQCTRLVGGCELTVSPKCGACGAGEVCAMDATCTPKCQPAGSVTKEESSFDAGSVAISGGTTPITLYPPYKVDGSADGAPFLAGAELRVEGSGAVGTGFEKFEDTFTATQFLQTSPPLAQLARSSVWGSGSLPITWVAGKDTVRVTIAGAGGSLRCNADDSKGRFDVPREVMKTALGPLPATTVSIALARERVEIKKGKKTKGQLATGSVPRIGWLSLSTTSMELATFQCSGDECTGTSLPTTCQDCRTSLCKTEFDACSADATCPMLRTCLDTCADAGCRSACFVKWPDPLAKAKNAALFKCQCTTQCATACASDCK